MTEKEKKLAEKNGTLREEYEALVNRKIRRRFSLSQELAAHRKRESEAEAFMALNDYIELCKQEAREEIYGEEAAV